MVVADCGPGGPPESPSPPVSPSHSFAPPPAAAGWTVQAFEVDSGANPADLELAVSPAGALVAGTYVATSGSAKGQQQPGTSAAYVWRCAGSPCRLVSGAVESGDILTPTPNGLAAASGSDGTVHVTRCTDVGCDPATTPYPTAATGHVAAFAADGTHLVSVSGTEKSENAALSVSSCPGGGCTAPALPFGAVDARFARELTAAAVRDGRVAMASRVADPHTVALQLCADAACRRLGRRVDVPGLTDPYPLSMRIRPDGRPVLLAGGDLVTCTDPACTGVVVTTVVPSDGRTGVDAALGVDGSGRPVVVAVTGGELRLHTCSDPQCGALTAQVVTTTVASTVAPTVRLAFAEAADGSAYVALLSRAAMMLFRGKIGG